MSSNVRIFYFAISAHKGGGGTERGVIVVGVGVGTVAAGLLIAALTLDVCCF